MCRGLVTIRAGLYAMARLPFSCHTSWLLICRTAEELREKDTVFYTGHCTGQKAIALMQPIMGEKMVQVYCGMEIFC